MNQIEIIAALELIKYYENNWDGNDGIKPNLQSILLTENITNLLLENNIYIDEIDADANGGVAIFVKNISVNELNLNKYCVIFIGNNGTKTIVGSSNRNVVFSGNFEKDSIEKIIEFLK